MQPGQHRETARIILRNQLGEIFLLKTHFDPEVGLPPRWITPGGGIDKGESPIEAAVRELFEETGIQVSTEQLGEQIWHTSGTWHWGDGINHHTYIDYFFEYVVDNFDLEKTNWTQDEHRDVLEYRWWRLDELATTQELIGPHGLSEYLLS